MSSGGLNGSLCHVLGKSLLLCLHGADEKLLCLLRGKPSSLFMSLGLSSVSVASLMVWSVCPDFCFSETLVPT
jgi:hypothetical protein